jgi:hypothetical protein
VGSEYRELKEIVNGLVDNRGWADLRQQCDEDDWSEWKYLLNSHITVAEQHARDQGSKLRSELREEIEMK